jgi:uncharacterized LabA/DUF88 family protein
MRRVIAYVDGQNLYYGLRARYGRRYHWLDLEALSTSLLPQGHQLVEVQYFTARVRNSPLSEARQHEYLGALEARSPLLRIIEGRFQERSEVCRTCGARRTTYEEKETDVNLATAMVRDAALDQFDTAILVSADGDLAPAIRTASVLRPTTKYYVALPPRRRSGGLSRVADATYTIGDAKIRNAQLPDKVILANGTVLERPAYWRQ